MAENPKPKLTPLQHLLTWAGTLLVGFGAMILLGVAAQIHPLLARPVVGWVFMIAGFVLSAGVSVSVVLGARRR